MSPNPPHAPIQPADPSLLRICIVAESASFRFGGEASLPLHYFSRLRARGIECWLVVHGRTQSELDQLFPNDRDRIHYIADQWFHRLIWRASRYLPRRVSEATFGTLMVLLNQLLQRSIVRELIRTQRIDIVHQPVPVSPKAPSFIANLGVPVLIGPMNGGMDFPAAFRSAESLFTRVAVALGRASANWVNILVPGKKDATLLLVANPRTHAALPRSAHGEVIEIPENGVDLRIWHLPTIPVPPSNPPRFVFVGRLVDWKRLDFALTALAQLPDAEIQVIGDGSMRASWTALAQSLNISDRIHWLGWRPQPECAAILQGATALVLPSIYECGGAVVLEAMACGIPVIATAWGGPADYLDPTCGILIPPTSADAITTGFAHAMTTLATQPELRTTLGKAGRLRVETLYDWEAKVDAILDLYRKAIHDFRP